MNKKEILYIFGAIVSLYFLFKLMSSNKSLTEGFSAETNSETTSEDTLANSDTTVPPSNPDNTTTSDADSGNTGTFSGEDLKLFSFIHEYASLKGLCDKNKLRKDVCARLRTNVPNAFDTIAAMLPADKVAAYNDYVRLVSSNQLDDVVNILVHDTTKNNKFKNIIRTMEELRN